MIKETQKMFLDNASGHAGVTYESRSQKNDENSLKKKKMLQSTIESLDDCCLATKMTKNISVLDDIKWIAKSC